MNKIIFIISLSSLLTVINNTSYSQFSNIYTPSDSIYTNIGGWSLKPMYSQKDSTPNPDSYFIKFYHKNIKFVKSDSTRNDGKPKSIFWLDNKGYIKRSPIDSLKLGYINLPFTSTTFITSSSTNILTNKTGLISLWTNDIGYLTNIISSQITSALGYSPYNGTSNPLNFISTSYIPTITSNVTRPINSTNYTISTTKQAFVSYSIKITCTATIGSTADGKVALQYSTNSGSTWIDVGEVENSNTVTLAIILQSSVIQTGNITGYIPINALVRMVSTISASGAIVSYIRGQETY